MNRRLARFLLRVYPRSWLNRYGEEFAALLEETNGSPAEILNVIQHGLAERLNSARGVGMKQTDFTAMIRKPSALIPIGMSLAALAVVVSHIALFGAVSQLDEGTAAHIWQLLMAGQLPVLAFFALKWLPRAPRPALLVLGLDAGAVLAAMAPVLLLGL